MQLKGKGKWKEGPEKNLKCFFFQWKASQGKEDKHVSVHKIMLSLSLWSLPYEAGKIPTAIVEPA